MNSCVEDVRVHNDHAIRIAIVSKPVSVVEYVKAVSALIGSSHILAVFEERDSIKIFLNDKRFVDTLMKSCLHVKGHHVKVDYVSPPGTRVVLTGVDPIISNYDVLRLLSAYGSAVSPVFRAPVSDDIELCHIGGGVRFVYMNFSTENVPEKIEFKYGEHLLSFKIQVETPDIMMIANGIKMDTTCDENSSSSILSHDPSSPPVLVSVQSVNCEEEESVSPGTLLTSTAINASPGSSETKRRVGRPANPLRRKRVAKSMTSTSKAAKKISRKVKHKWLRRRYRRGKVGSKQTTEVISLDEKPPNSSSFRNSTVPDVPTAEGEKIEEQDATVEVLDQERLQEFLGEVKSNRAPLEVAKRYLGDDCDSINKLIEQLSIFRRQQTDKALMNRLYRLIKSLQDSLNSSNLSVSQDLE